MEEPVLEVSGLYIILHSHPGPFFLFCHHKIPLFSNMEFGIVFTVTLKTVYMVQMVKLNHMQLQYILKIVFRDAVY